MAGPAFTDPDFSTNYIDVTKVGTIQGGYHYAHPDISEGGTQANFTLVSTYNCGNVDALFTTCFIQVGGPETE